MREQSPDPSRHLVGVWNPSYAADPMDVHLAVLRNAAAAYRAHGSSEGEVYVWWAKLRSSGRPHAMRHDAEIRQFAEEVPVVCRSGGEVHLYLTDYRSLYVGHVAEIAFDEVRDHDRAHVPKYVRERTASVAARQDVPGRDAGRIPPYRHDADCWFKLLDIRRLVADDTTAVAEELRRLANTHEGGRAVSLYGSMYDLPLLVERSDGARFFDAAERDPHSGRAWWAELDAKRGRGIGAMEAELRDNVVGREAWRWLQPTARAFIAAAEMTFRERRSDAAFDFSPVVIGFGKGLEAQVGWLVREALTAAPEDARWVDMGSDRKRNLLAKDGHMPTLGEVTRLLDLHPPFRAAIEALPNGRWLTDELRPVLDSFAASVRNPAAHDRFVDLSDATRWRDRLLGVGQPGVLERFAGVGLQAS